MAAWQPNVDGISQILTLLQLSQSPDHEIQKQVNQQLQQLHSFPDYNKYLTYIFAQMKDQEEYIRTVAGLVLKNNIKEYYPQMNEDVRSYIKMEVIKCIGDHKTTIRRTVGTILTTIIETTSVKECPGLLQLFAQLLDNNDVNLIDGTLSALQKICQDSAEKLDEEDGEMGRPLQVLIPKLFRFFTSEHDAFRKFSLSCINQFIVPMPQILASNVDLFVKGLLHLANDESPDVKVLVCQAFITLVEVRFEYVKHYMPAILDAVLKVTQDDDETVALEACEFWPAVAETRACGDLLRACLPRLLPVLLDGMIYTDNDVSMFDTLEQDDENVPDKPEDVRPFIYGRRSDHVSTDAEDDEDGDDDDDDDDTDPSDWSLRKCSAAGLDILAAEFGVEVLPVILPVISKRLQESDPEQWPVKESAILAMGAIADGCGSEMERWLPELVPFLLQTLTHPKPLVRSITCWTLCRYSQWIVDQEPASQFLEPFLAMLLERLLDPHKRVQEAAISALATFEEVSRNRLVPYLAPVLRGLVAAYAKYQAKNLLILYDAIGTLAETVGPQLNQPHLVAILLPPLVQRWNELPDDDTRLFPLLECLTCVVTSLGTGFLQYAAPVFARCLKLIEGTVLAEMHNAPHIPDKDFIVCSLDLVGGLAEGLREHVEPLTKESRLLELLSACIKHPSGDVRQSAFALVGELAKSCVGVLRPWLGQYIPVLLENLHPEYHSACNNAVWAIGEIAMRMGSEMEPWAKAILVRIVQLMNVSYISPSLMENAAITVGRLGLGCPSLCGPYLEEFVKPWCLALRNVRDDSEKESAFRGLCAMIQAYPQGAVKHLSYVADAIASWEHPKPDLAQAFAHILHSFKNSLPPEAWSHVYDSWSHNLKSILHERYKI